jgi:hypothetical protein
MSDTALPGSNPAQQVVAGTSLLAGRSLAAHQRPQSVKITVITALEAWTDEAERCWASVAAQTYPDIEHLIVDLRPGDQASEPDARRTTLKGVRGIGVFGAWDQGIAHTQGDVLCCMPTNAAFANAEVLAKVAAAFEDPWLSAVYGDVQEIRQRGSHRIIRTRETGPFSPAKLSRGWAVPTPALFVRSRWYRRVGGFSSPALPLAAEYATLLRLFGQPHLQSRYLKAALIEQPAGSWRSLTRAQTWHQTAQELQALRLTGAGGPLSWAARLWQNMRSL